MIIKRISAEDFDSVLTLYEKNKDVLSPLDRNKLEMLEKLADIFDVVIEDDLLIAYLIAFREGVDDYDIKSYLWFSDRYAKFLYIDSVVVEANYRSKGLGKALYRRAIDYANDSGVAMIAAAITKEPYNEASMAFHRELGFKEVGEQDIRNGTVRISQQVAEIL